MDNRHRTLKHWNIGTMEQLNNGINEQRNNLQLQLLMYLVWIQLNYFCSGKTTKNIKSSLALFSSLLSAIAPREK
jgi:hypothetical protein